MADWEISCSAGSDFVSLVHSFGGNDIALDYDNSPETGMRFMAYSSHLNKLAEPVDVSRRAFSLNIILNGALRIEAGYLSHPIIFHELFNEQEQRFYEIKADSIEEMPYDSDTSIDKDDDRFSTPAWLIKKSKTDQPLRTLLILSGLISLNDVYSRILTWSTLYKILETVRYCAKSNGMPTRSLAEEKQVNKFTAACNCMSILGFHARHGMKKNIPPKEVITDIEAATLLILGMTKELCRQMYNLSGMEKRNPPAQFSIGDLFD